MPGTSGNNCGASQFFMQNAPASVYMMDPEGDSCAAAENPCGGALQKPEENRLHLETMLRRVLKKQESRKSGAAHWRGFLAGYTGKNANGNDSAA